MATPTLSSGLSSVVIARWKPGFLFYRGSEGPRALSGCLDPAPTQPSPAPHSPPRHSEMTFQAPCREY